MRLPRDWDGEDLVRGLTKIGYVVVRLRRALAANPHFSRGV